MLFSKKTTSFHCLVLYIQKDQPHPLHVIIPHDMASDVISTMRKLEKSNLNHETFLGSLGPFMILHEIQQFNKIHIYNDTYPWSEPMLYTDFAKKVNERLQSLLDEEMAEVEDDLVFFVGEFTMMQDNGFIAPF